MDVGRPQLLATWASPRDSWSVPVTEQLALSKVSDVRKKERSVLKWEPQAV